MNEQTAPLDSRSFELQKKKQQAVRGRQADYRTSVFLFATNHMSGPVWSDIRPPRSHEIMCLKMSGVLSFITQPGPYTAIVFRSLRQSDSVTTVVD